MGVQYLESENVITTGVQVTDGTKMSGRSSKLQIPKRAPLRMKKECDNGYLNNGAQNGERSMFIFLPFAKTSLRPRLRDSPSTTAAVTSGL